MSAAHQQAVDEKMPFGPLVLDKDTFELNNHKIQNTMTNWVDEQAVVDVPREENKLKDILQGTSANLTKEVGTGKYVDVIKSVVKK